MDYMVEPLPETAELGPILRARHCQASHMPCVRVVHAIVREMRD